MICIRRRASALLLAVLLGAALAACSGEEKNTDDESLRIPDSLLAPIHSYGLITDEYHPIDGGVMANEDIVLLYPASPIARFVSVKTFGFARSGWQRVTELIGRPADDQIVLVGALDLDEYRFLTRKEWWYYGVVQGDTIWFEPFDIMIKRQIAEIGITQKLAQAALNRRSGGRLPLWLREAVASYVAGERSILEAQAAEFAADGYEIDIDPATVEADIEAATDRGMTRVAFFAAYRMLERMLERWTMDDVLRFASLLGEGRPLDDASADVFGAPWAEVIDRIRIDRAGTGEEAPGT